MNYIKNIEHQKVLSLINEVDAQDGQIVSKTLAQNNALSITLFAFSAGEEIGTHGSDGDALVTVMEGEGRFVVGDDTYILKAGESLVMPAGIPHSVHADQKFKMQLTVVFPDNS
ncbi:MAG: cupin domain-containing protein [Clostridiaceae bacterium]|jgi:quercetin dioxygenase-like cupin family protein|nr:cupin domain-containing protein [Bacillota bacterium]NLN51885.1 cupin domain-containing protein [Clostridiaceae bacterium]